MSTTDLALRPCGVCSEVPDELDLVDCAGCGKLHHFGCGYRCEACREFYCSAECGRFHERNDMVICGGCG